MKSKMPVILFLVNLLEIIFELFLFMVIMHLHLIISYSFMLFLFDFFFVFFVIFDTFLPEKFEKYPLFESKRYAKIMFRTLGFLALLVIVYYWDIVGVTLKNLWH